MTASITHPEVFSADSTAHGSRWASVRRNRTVQRSTEVTRIFGAEGNTGAPEAGLLHAHVANTSGRAAKASAPDGSVRLCLLLDTLRHQSGSLRADLPKTQFGSELRLSRHFSSLHWFYSDVFSSCVC